MNAVDQPRIRAAVSEILAALGADPQAPHLAQTPERVAAAYAEWCSGVGVDPHQILLQSIAAECPTGDLVGVRDVEFTALCEHHLLPFHGKAHIAYLPGEKIVGLGALARVTQALAARPQLQERLGAELAGAIHTALSTRGTLVVLEARHGCLSDRGPKQLAARALTIAAEGELRTGALRDAALALLTWHDRGVELGTIADSDTTAERADD